DNHIQLQYEIISKQLTLLRDEVGPGERLVFLELPQSINATQDKAENKLAQVWWRIAGYTTVNKSVVFSEELANLQKQIGSIDINIEQNQTLIEKNKKNSDALGAQLSRLCKQKADRENEKENKKKDLADAQTAKDAAETELDATTKLKEQADAELAAARTAEDRKRITSAEAKADQAAKELAKAQEKKKSADDKRQQTCSQLMHDLDLLTDSLKQIEKVIETTRKAIQQIDDQNFKLE